MLVIGYNPTVQVGSIKSAGPVTIRAIPALGGGAHVSIGNDDKMDAMTTSFTTAPIPESAPFPLESDGAYKSEMTGPGVQLNRDHTTLPGATEVKISTTTTTPGGLAVTQREFIHAGPGGIDVKSIAPAKDGKAITDVRGFYSQGKAAFNTQGGDTVVGAGLAHGDIEVNATGNATAKGLTSVDGWVTVRAGNRVNIGDVTSINGGASVIAQDDDVSDELVAALMGN